MGISDLYSIKEVIPKLDMIFRYIEKRFASEFGYDVMKEFTRGELMYAINHWNRSLEKTEPSDICQRIVKLILKIRLDSLRKKLERRFRLRLMRPS